MSDDVADKEIPVDFLLTEQNHHGKSRTRRVMLGSFATIGNKIAALLITFVTIPLVLHSLGKEQFAVWMTISTSLTMLVILDLGIANSLTNLISAAYAKNDRDLAGQYAATSFWLMCGVAIVLVLISAICNTMIDWQSLYGVSASVAPAATHATEAAFLVFAIGLPATLGAKLLGGYQEIKIANVFALIGNVLSFIFILTAAWFGAGLVVFCCAAAIGVTLGNILCMAWLWLRHKPWLLPRPSRIDASMIGTLLSTGKNIFVIQIAGLAVLNSDNFIVGHYLGAANVTPYSVTWRIVSYASFVQALMVPSLWPAYAEAFVRRDMVWIRRTFRRTLTMTLGAAAAFCLFLVCFGTTAIGLWAGPRAVPSELLLCLMCAYVLISVYQANTACILMAANEIRLQAICSVFCGVFNLTLGIYLVQHIGAPGVVSGTILAYALTLVGPQTWQAWKLLR